MVAHLQTCSPQAVLTCAALPSCVTRRKLLRPERSAHSRRCRQQQRAFVDQPAQLDAEDPKVKAQMDALAEQMQRPEVQEQMQEVQALMQDKSFAEKVEKLREDPELAPYFEKARSGDPAAMMKLMSDPELTQKVMAKLGNAPQQPSQTSQEPPEINSLQDAAKYGDLEAIEDFIAIGRDINEGDPDGRTALHYAVVYDKQDVVKALIEAGVDLEKSEDLQNTPLHYACGYGRGMCVEILIDAGANTHATNNSGKTGLDLVKLSDKNPINADDELVELLS